MISNVIAILFSMAFASGVMILIRLNNDSKLTLRGRRLVFVVSLVAGFFVAQFFLHFNVNCDLRPNATTTECQVAWFQAQLFNPPQIAVVIYQRKANQWHVSK